jgi:hypothetical protein
MPKLKQQSGLLRGLCLYRALQPEPCDALFCSPNPVLYYTPIPPCFSAPFNRQPACHRRRNRRWGSRGSEGRVLS